MITVNQTIFMTETTKGNCLAACLASILEIDISQVPNFAESKHWEFELNGWLKGNYGVCFLELPITEHLRFVTEDLGLHHIICGPSPRGDFWHSVVGKGGKIIHDPHPDKTGLKEEKTFCFLCKI